MCILSYRSQCSPATPILLSDTSLPRVRRGAVARKTTAIAATLKEIPRNFPHPSLALRL